MGRSLESETGITLQCVSASTTLQKNKKNHQLCLTDSMHWLTEVQDQQRTEFIFFHMQTTNRYRFVRNTRQSCIRVNKDGAGKGQVHLYFFNHKTDAHAQPDTIRDLDYQRQSPEPAG